MQKRWSGSFLGGLLLATAMHAPRANCIPNKTLTSLGAEGYFYVNLPWDANHANVIGRFWQVGGRDLANEGTFDDAQWLHFYAGTGKWYIVGELGTAGVVGCPTGSLLLTLDTLSGHNLTIEVDETPGGVAHYDLSRFHTDFSLGAKPRPIVRSSHREGTDIVLDLDIAAQSAGIYSLGSAVAATPSYRIMSARRSSDPGPLASAYTPGPLITPGTLVAFTTDCSGAGLDTWIAVQTIVDGMSSDTVGARTRLMCGFLADPAYKHVDRPGRPERRGR